MTSKKRIENLVVLCEQCRESVENAEEQKQEIISWKNDGLLIFENDNNEDLIPLLINEAENVVNVYRKLLAKMIVLRDRAFSGEDV